MSTCISYDPTDPDFSSHQAHNLFGPPAEVRDADGLRFYEYDWRGLPTKFSHRFWAQQDASGNDWTDTSTTFWSDSGTPTSGW